MSACLAPTRTLPAPRARRWSAAGGPVRAPTPGWACRRRPREGSRRGCPTGAGPRAACSWFSSSWAGAPDDGVGEATVLDGVLHAPEVPLEAFRLRGGLCALPQGSQGEEVHEARITHGLEAAGVEEPLLDVGREDIGGEMQAPNARHITVHGTRHVCLLLLDSDRMNLTAPAPLLAVVLRISLLLPGAQLVVTASLASGSSVLVSPSLPLSGF
mmetsp:Transcript_23868/g.58939  ORF Transcript_23868/g.58939 Transcript_23868/m.58939 type:complete len:214 (+) Transcript_23868:320-961(+)